MKNKYQVVALIGKAGAGKDTIQKVTCDLHPDIFNPIVSCTTRPVRDGEVDGVAYHFLSINEFTRKVLNGEMLEATEFRDWFYGTSIEALDPNKINLGVFNPAGISALLESPEIEVTVIYVQAPDKIRLMRYLNRETNPDCAEMCRRYFTDENDFANLDFDYYVLENYDGGSLDLVHSGHSMNIVLERIWYRLGAQTLWKEISADAIKAESSDNKANAD